MISFYYWKLKGMHTLWNMFNIIGLDITKSLFNNTIYNSHSWYCLKSKTRMIQFNTFLLKHNILLLRFSSLEKNGIVLKRYHICLPVYFSQTVFVTFDISSCNSHVDINLFHIMHIMTSWSCLWQLLFKPIQNILEYGYYSLIKQMHSISLTG